MPTYAKVGVFLLKVLATELKAGRQAPQFASYKSATDVMTAFRSQFEAFTRQYPPFIVTQFVAVKIFAILPNSMPEDAPPSKPPSLNWRSVKALMGQQNTTACSGTARGGRAGTG
ncbi:hypothetical protein B0H13DRAFT_1898288 [Mycena leptocephala]|nr:hypothetical protein B0H13DRAFT_1898288 [Mycena leptocephala]